MKNDKNNKLGLIRVVKASEAFVAHCIKETHFNTQPLLGISNIMIQKLRLRGF